MSLSQTKPPFVINAYEAQVIVNGTALPEFQATVKDGMATCYIPSEVGQSFAVKWTNITIKQQNSLYLQLYFDGHLVAERGFWNYSDQNEVVFEGKRISDTSVRSFVFASREEINDGHDNGSVVNYSDKLGEIRLDVSAAIITEVKCTCRCMTKFERKPDGVLDDAKVERAVREVPHRIRYADEVTKERSSIPSESGCSGRHRTYEPAKVFATFIFKYRPIDVLQANNIAPRPSQLGSNGPTQSSVMKRATSARRMEVYCIEESDELISEGEEEESDFLYV